MRVDIQFSIFKILDRKPLQLDIRLFSLLDQVKYKYFFHDIMFKKKFSFLVIITSNLDLKIINA